MSGFHALDSFSSLHILLVGLVTAIGAWGVGKGLLSRLATPSPSAWWQAVRFLLGLLILSLSVQVIAFTEVATLFVLRSVWVVFVSVGCSVTILSIRKLATSHERWSRPRGAFGIASASILMLGLLTNLLIGLNPSTKIDEIFYHMLVPARILADEGLLFYAYPWEAAILPHLGFHIGLTPLHALRTPDAGNILSWAAALLLAGIAVDTCRQISGSMPWAYFTGALFVTGLYPAVNHVTSGAHSIGDLALCAAVIGLFWLFDERSLIDPLVASAGFGILAVATASTKVSLLPLAILTQGFAVFILLLRHRVSWRRTLLSAVLPWMIFYVPLMAWTASASGSPFGPLLTGAFPSKIYEPGETEELVASSLAVNQVGLLTFLRDMMMTIPFAIWPLMAAFFVRSRSRRLAAFFAALFLFQAFLIAFYLPHQVRFFGGLHFGLAILGAASVAKIAVAKRWISAFALFCVLPWLAVQIYYARPFITALWPGERTKFHERYVPMLVDLRALDSLLPSNAQLVIIGIRGPSFYSPRPVFYDTRDLRPDRPAFVLLAEAAGTTVRRPDGLREEQLIYSNEKANIYTFRRPGFPPAIGHVSVYRLR